jgi:hypothetical protein
MGHTTRHDRAGHERLAADWRGAGCHDGGDVDGMGRVRLLHVDWVFFLVARFAP